VRRRSLDHELPGKLDSEGRKNDANARGEAFAHVLSLALAPVEAIEEQDVMAELRKTKRARRPGGAAAGDENLGVEFSSQSGRLRKRT
jgi:hypothetical protein